jgi:hypothetical protein
MVDMIGDGFWYPCEWIWLLLVYDGISVIGWMIG